MTSREFFYLVANMRAAQRSYFRTKERKAFIAARSLEDQVDAEIRRVKDIVDGNTTQF